MNFCKSVLESIDPDGAEGGDGTQNNGIELVEGPIKKIGEYPIIVHLGTDTDATINLIVETNNQS